MLNMIPVNIIISNDHLKDLFTKGELLKTVK